MLNFPHLPLTRVLLLFEFLTFNECQTFSTSSSLQKKTFFSAFLSTQTKMCVAPPTIKKEREDNLCKLIELLVVALFLAACKFLNLKIYFSTFQLSMFSTNDLQIKVQYDVIVPQRKVHKTKLNEEGAKKKVFFPAAARRTRNEVN